MGCENIAEKVEKFVSTSPPSLSDSLLFDMMCIIGLPVDLHVRDGSVYSGIFHTASVDKDFGIVLKKAKLTKKGRCNANVSSGDIVDTLVVLSRDLVQVVSKGALLPSNGIGNTIGDSVEAAMGIAHSSNGSQNEAKKSTRSVNKKSSIRNENGFAHCFTPRKSRKEYQGKKSVCNQMRNAREVEHDKTDGKNMGKGQEVSHATVSGRQEVEEISCGMEHDHNRKLEFHVEESAEGVQGSSVSSADTCPAQAKPVGEGNAMIKFDVLQNEASCNAAPDVKLGNQCCERPSSAEISTDAICSTSTSMVTDATSESFSSSLAAKAEMVPPKNSEPNKSSKEFKLNPGAKIFSPSSTNLLSTSPRAPTAANMAYIPSNTHIVAAAGSQPDVTVSAFAPRSSAPTKFVPYSSMTAGNGVSASQFSQPIVGHIGSRTQPVRYAGQYHPVQAAPAYFNPNSQAVMVGRQGQLLYVQPVSHDLAHGATAISQLPARPPLSPHQVQFPKHQGSVAAGQALQLCVPHPLVANGQQALAVPSHIPLLQPPFPANRPIPVPGSNGLVAAKLP